jgi:glycosyltransferase involved in cell wall biosynthesis
METRLPEGWDRRVIIIDDCSDQATATVVDELSVEDDRTTALRHPDNRGKGAAVRTGIAHALSQADDADVIIIQDADLEYHPDDFAVLLEALQSERFDVIYGDRFDRGRRRSPMGWLHTRVNRMLTRLSNLATGLDVNDMECCYKAIPVPIMRRILPELNEDRFGVEPQITAALAREGCRIGNQLIAYDPRDFKSGKKIGAKDGIRAVFVILREWSRRRRES